MGFLTGSSIKSRLEALAVILKSTQCFWKDHSFYLASNQKPNWTRQYPELFDELTSISLKQAEDLSNDDQLLLGFLSPRIDHFSELAKLCVLPELPSNDITQQYNNHFSAGIPGRKWQQILRFLGPLENRGNSALEWCGGKAHLGRAISHAWQVPVTSFDLDETLVASAQKLSRTRLNTGAQIDHVVCDALSADSEVLVQNVDHALALHACGGLHVQLLQTAVKLGTPQLSIAPCCYHRFTCGSEFQPISDAGKTLLAELGLTLTELDLRTAVTMTATADAYTQKLRTKAQIWRLGFDQLQRDLTGVDQYMPLASFSMNKLKEGFAQFCLNYLKAKGVDVSHKEIDFQHYLEVGHSRFARVTQLDLVRLGCRRAIELLVVLDRAQYLHENHYKVDVGTFCNTQITPRNIMIRAIK